MIRITILFVSFFMIFSCTFKECDYQDLKNKLETINDAQWKNITLDLSMLFKDNQGYKIEKIDNDKYIKRNGLSDYEELSNKDLELIKRLKNIGFRSIEFLSTGDININIGGCVDDKLYVHMTGLNDDEKSRLYITWGEQPLKEKTLWKINN